MTAIKFAQGMFIEQNKYTSREKQWFYDPSGVEVVLGSVSVFDFFLTLFL